MSGIEVTSLTEVMGDPEKKKVFDLMMEVAKVMSGHDKVTVMCALTNFAIHAGLFQAAQH